MVGHLGHTTIIHAAIWMPLLIVAVNQMHQSQTLIWWVIGIAAVCSAILAGHPQIGVYALVLCGVLAAYHLVSSSVSLKRVDTRLLLLYVTCFVLGIGLSAIQLLPMADLAARSVRAQFSFEDFTSYSLPFSHLPLLFFPFLFGPQSAFFGSWNFTELACYFGATTFVTLSPRASAKRSEHAFLAACSYRNVDFYDWENAVRLLCLSSSGCGILSRAGKGRLYPYPGLRCAFRFCRCRHS